MYRRDQKYRGEGQPNPQARANQQGIGGELSHGIQAYGHIGPQRAATTDPLTQQVTEVSGVECDLLEHGNYKQRQTRPQKWGSPRPGRNQQQPSVEWRIPE